MAKFEENAIIGGLGNLSFYKMRGVEKTIVRSKGGASAEKIKNSANFAKTRKNNQEWSACSKMGKAIRDALHPLKHLADYNVSGPLNAIAKKIQALDQEHVHGERSVSLSKQKIWLHGFSYNQKKNFSCIIRTPVQFEIIKELETVHAKILLPQLIPGINFHPNNNWTFYKIIAVLGCVPDFQYNPQRKEYETANGTKVTSAIVISNWLLSNEPQDEKSLEITGSWGNLPSEGTTLVLGLGIVFGKALSAQLIEEVKYSGNALILGTA